MVAPPTNQSLSRKEFMDTSKWKMLLKSRKFWAAVVGLIVVFLEAFVPNFPFDGEQLLYFVVTVVGYILGTGIEDGLARRQ